MVFTKEDLKNNREEIINFFYKEKGVKKMLKSFMELLVLSVEHELYSPLRCNNINDLCYSHFDDNHHRGIEVKISRRERRLTLEQNLKDSKEEEGKVWNPVKSVWEQKKY